MKDESKNIIEACNTSISMAAAATKLGMHFNTFRRRATELGVYSPNQGLKGGTRYKTPRYQLSDILEGKHPQYQTNKLRLRLIREKIKEQKCEICKVDVWNGKLLSLELNHKDGDRTNHRLENLEIICPNCHSQTPTFRGRNIRQKSNNV